MVKIWRNCIEARTQEFANCPDRYKDEVLELMRKDVEEGNMTPKGELMTPELFKELTGIDY